MFCTTRERRVKQDSKSKCSDHLFRPLAVHRSLEWKSKSKWVGESDQPGCNDQGSRKKWILCVSLHSRTGSNNSSLCKMLQKLKLPTSVIFLHYHHPKPHKKTQQTLTSLRYFFELLVWGKWRGASIIIICHLSQNWNSTSHTSQKKSSSTHTLLFCFRILSCLSRLFLVPEVRVSCKTGPLRAGKLHKNNWINIVDYNPAVQLKIQIETAAAWKFNNNKKGLFWTKSTLACFIFVTFPQRAGPNIYPLESIYICL